MNVSISINENIAKLLEQYVALSKLSLSEYVEQTLLQKLEDEEDLKAYHEGMEEYRKNPVTYTHDEVGKMLGINNV